MWELTFEHGPYTIYYVEDKYTVRDGNTICGSTASYEQAKQIVDALISVDSALDSSDQCVYRINPTRFLIWLAAMMGLNSGITIILCYILWN